MTLGIPGEPKPYMSGEPFHRCTHTALSPQGDLYVSDGYGNARIHKYTPDGKLLMSWGEPGTDPGQFNIPHNICCDPDGWVYVADRENHRVQVFDGNGKFETQWNNLHRPNGMCMAAGRDPLFYIGEGGPSGEINRDWPNIGPRVSIHTSKGKVLARLGKMHAGLAPGQFTSPHGIAVDGHGNIYVGELSGRSWPRFPRSRRPSACGSSTSSSKAACRAAPHTGPARRGGAERRAAGATCPRAARLARRETRSPPGSPD